MKIIDLSNAVFKTELNEPSDLSIPALTAYFRYNVGDLNNLLGTCYKLNPATLEIVDENGCEISSEASMIYKYLYLLNYYSRQIRANLGVGGASIVTQVSSDQGVVRLVDKTNVAKVYLDMKKEVTNQLKNLVNRYKFRQDGGNPRQIEGDDIFVNINSFQYRENGIKY